MPKIRNIIQSMQEREIIKTAPDMVVYIDGLPYFPNFYLKGDSAPYVVVNFNDYITAISCNYGVDNLMPSGSLNLSIPNGSKHLFLTPGGGFMLQPMSEVKIYAKTYFFSKSGNSRYKRVFNGMIKSVDYNETNTALEVAISCVGSMRWLELMQVDKKPAILSFSDQGVVPYQTTDAHLNPYQILAGVFTRALDFSGFVKSNLFEQLQSYGVRPDSLVNWQTRLNNLKKYIHIFGYKNKITTSPLPVTKVDKGAKGGKKEKPEEGIAKQESEMLVNLINQHLPEMSIGSINLLDSSNIVSRLERVRQVIESIGYEGYQDLDGSIIIKPPIYNLDCTLIGDTSKLRGENLSDTTNPYIIHLSEVLGENYMEDESGIRRTRMSVKGTMYPEGYQQDIGVLQKTGSFTDVNLVRKYGIRDEAVKTLTFLGNNTSVCFAFAAMELAKANKNAKTYHVTIPMRPELKLGFPIFIPHLDMYAYITAISLSYNVGGRADMSLTCNFIRKRPQRYTEQEITGSGKSIIYTSQPNLVHYIAGKSAPTLATASSGVAASAAGAAAMGAVLTQSPAAGLSDTLLNPEVLNSSDNALNAYIKNKAGSIFETAPDTASTNWRIKEDSFFDGKLKDGKKTVVPQNKKYLDKLRESQPYTDEKGYEVISPFAWGRYSTLSDALYSFTRDADSNLDASSNTSDTTKTFDDAAKAFVYAGLVVPYSKDSAGTLSETLTNELMAFDNSNVTSFELNFSNSNSSPVSNAFPSTTNGQPSSIPSTATGSSTPPPVNADPLQRAQTFLEGVATSLSNYMSGGANDSGNNISTLPQNTALGGYAAPGTTYEKLKYAINPKFASSTKRPLG